MPVPALSPPQHRPRAAARPAPGGGPAAWLAIPHSRRVALLKRLLPAIGVALLLLVALWPRLAPLWERMRLAFPAIDLRDARELRMINPRYAGIDREGRPFVVTAAVGRQVPDRRDLMSLKAPRADMKTHAGATVVVTAATGIYQSQSQLLDLFGGVTVVHQNGTRFVTDTARVDAAHNTAQGTDPIAGHGPSGDVEAQGFRILDRGDTILFTGRSHLLLRSASAGAHAGAPAALPAPIAATAARVADEARPMLAAARAASSGPAAAPHHAAPHHAATRHAAAARRHVRPLHHLAARRRERHAGRRHVRHPAPRAKTASVER
ncbi:MAG TPA: LPS export ABC transporter periplasmic protein LptC [Stellaceae bacterium]|nr:LPS export ABC transporter periplasmic protein LptC [Stellaceae bacterium]